MSNSQGPPSILYLHCHDLGRQLGCYGRQVRTPNVDALAEEGVRFDDYNCSAPQCSPSRGSVMTGKYPHRNGLMGLTHRGWSLDDDQIFLPEAFEDIGYDTYCLGTQHAADDATDLGFGYVDQNVDHALDAADRFADLLPDLTASTDPFFVSLGFAEPHRPFQREVAEEYYDTYHPENVDVPTYLPDEQGVREDVADLAALITGAVDRGVARVREALEDAGILDETVVVFSTDHGLDLPRAKGMCYDPGLESALIARYPPAFDRGAVRDEMLSNVDLMPTLLDLCGGEVPAGIDGRSFAPLLTGETDAYRPRESIRFEITWHDRYNPIRGIKTDRYKYLRNFSMLPRYYIPRGGFDAKAARPVRGEYYSGERPAEELYDLERDPNEQENLAPSDRPSRTESVEWNLPDAPVETPDDAAAALNDLRAQLRKWMVDTDDQLLDGPVGIPGE